MWKVDQPTFSALHTFETCIMTISDEGLRDRLEESLLQCMVPTISTEKPVNAELLMVLRSQISALQL